jgi:prevent-host-death family protein
MTMRVGATELRNKIGDLLARIRYAQERFIIEHRGEPVAAVISIKDLEELERLEDERDAALLELAERTSEGLVPFKELVAQYERLFGESLELPEGEDVQPPGR